MPLLRTHPKRVVVKLIAFAYMCFGLAAAAIGENADPSPRFVSRERWDQWIQRMRDYDELRLINPNVVGITTKYKNGKQTVYSSRSISNHTTKRITKIPDPNSLFDLLEFDPRFEATSHGCRGLFNVHLYKKGEPVRTFHYAHGQFWSALTENSQKLLADWLEANGLPVKKQIKQDHASDAKARAEMDSLMLKARTMRHGDAESKTTSTAK